MSPERATVWDEHRSLLKRLRAMDNEAEFAAADLIESLWDEVQALRTDCELLVALIQHVTAHDPHWAVSEWVQDEDVSTAEHDRICAAINGSGIGRSEP